MQQRKTWRIPCTSHASGFDAFFCHAMADDQFGGRKLERYMLPGCRKEMGPASIRHGLRS